ncbi:MAG: DUF72 domain-containing protein, partial [Candidatus Pacebacteria bacterium]|nr:DUF72 domain-containing protein [Candidatus Paceibacterota bacterium]
MKLFIGTSGWSYKHWQGIFYPRKLTQNKWLNYYSKHFNTVELNMSFYRFPSIEIIDKWQKELPEEFKMTLKANRMITHVKRFKNVDRILADFYALAEGFKNNLGCILFQAPPFFKYSDENVEIMANFLKILDKEKRNAVEFRHLSWWNQKVYELFQKEEIGFCSVSGLNMPEDAITTSKFAYIRFHGPDEAYSSKYSEEELKEWAKKINSLKTKEIFCYFNNDQNAYAVENAKELRK